MALRPAQGHRTRLAAVSAGSMVVVAAVVLALVLGFAGRGRQAPTATTLAGAGPALVPPGAFTAMTFNILDGAVGKGPAIAKVVRAVNPDIVSLDEADDPATAEQIATATGLREHLCLGNNEYHIALLTRWTIESASCYTAYPIQKSVNIAVLRSPAGLRVVVYACHMTPLQGYEKRRGEEMRTIVGLAAEQHPDLPALVMGDLNSQPADDGATENATVTPVLTAAGWVDSYREVHPDAHAFPGLTAGAHFNRRFDYIWHTPTLRATAAGVVSGAQLRPWPSDHNAVWAVLEPTTVTPPAALGTP